MTLALTRLLIGLPIYGLWYAAAAWLLTGRLGPAIAVGWTLLMPPSGIMALHYWYRVREAERLWWQEFRMLLDPGKLKGLRAGQAELCCTLSAMAEEYALVRPRQPY